MGYEYCDEEKHVINVEYAKKQVEKIIKERGSDEMAHIFEDDLYHSFVSHVAENDSGYLGEIAREIIKSEDVKFNRWTA